MFVIRVRIKRLTWIESRVCPEIYENCVTSSQNYEDMTSFVFHNIFKLFIIPLTLRHYITHGLWYIITISDFYRTGTQSITRRWCKTNKIIKCHRNTWREKILCSFVHNLECSQALLHVFDCLHQSFGAHAVHDEIAIHHNFVVVATTNIHVWFGSHLS